MNFEDEPALAVAIQVIHSKLLGHGSQPKSIVIKNERGEMLGFNPAYCVSHRISDVTDWIPTWVLPAEGAPAPPRES